jgi:hypothetical protein
MAKDKIPFLSKPIGVSNHFFKLYNILITNRILKMPFFGSTMVPLLVLYTSLIVIITCTFYYDGIIVNYAYAEGKVTDNSTQSR